MDNRTKTADYIKKVLLNDKTKKVAFYLILFMGTIIFVFPILWVGISSFKNNIEMFAWPPTLWPKNPTIENYTLIFQHGNYLRYFQNTFVVAIISTIITVFINVMAGFALAKYQFKGRNLIFGLFLGALMFPMEVRLVPSFLILRHLALYDTLWAIIIPPAASPTGVFLARQFMFSIPDELMSSARIDGASEWKVFTRIIVPLSKPVILALTILSFLWRWNDFLNPFIAISSESNYTIQLAIANYVGQFNVEWHRLLSMNIVAIIPVLIVFLVFQKYFVKGIAMTGMKS